MSGSLGLSQRVGFWRIAVPISFAICIRIDAEWPFNQSSMGFSACWKSLPVTGFLRFFPWNAITPLLRVAYFVQPV